MSSQSTLTTTDTSNNNTNIKQGWLYKLTWINLHRSWQRRYFVLDNRELRYYKQQDDPCPIGTVDLRLYSDVVPYPSKHLPYTFRIDSECHYHRTYLLYAETETDFEHWLEVLKSSIHPAGHDSYIYDFENDSGSVLDKWLERLDLMDNDAKASPTSRKGSTSWTSQTSLVTRSMTVSAAAPAPAERMNDDSDDEQSFIPLQRRVTMPEQYIASLTKNEQDEVIALPTRRPPPTSPPPPTPRPIDLSPRSI